MDDKSITPKSFAAKSAREADMACKKIDMQAALEKAEETRDHKGATYRKDRIGHKDRHGFFPLSQLRKDEFVIAPGIIYRKATDA